MTKNFKLTPYVFAKIRELSGRGFDRKMMADFFGIPPKQFKELEERFPEITEYIQMAQVKRVNYVAGKLEKLIDEGNFNAIKFYLTTQGKQFGFTEEPVDRPKQVNLTLNTTDPIEAAKIYQKIMQGS